MNKLTLVEAISVFRTRYVIESDGNVTSESIEPPVKEFSQLHVGETILSTREITLDEALKMCDEDNDYARTWNDEMKIKAFINGVNDA